MNGVLPLPGRSSVCLLYRQSLKLSRLQQQQQQQEHLMSQTSYIRLSQHSRLQLSCRRFISCTTHTQPPAASAALTTPSSVEVVSSSVISSHSKVPYTRHSLYLESDPSTTMRPPPRPSVKAIGPTKPQETEKGVSEPPSDLLTALKSGSAADPIQAVATASTQKNTAPAIASVKPTTRRPSKLRAPRKAAMHLTPAAVEQIRALLEGPDPKLLKVGVRNRGCSGLAYNLEYVGKPGAFDELVEQDGVRVLVDSKALFSIIGSEMDWVEDKLNQRFVFRNPNIKEQCGCGESFMV